MSVPTPPPPTTPTWEEREAAREAREDRWVAAWRATLLGEGEEDAERVRRLNDVLDDVLDVPLMEVLDDEPESIPRALALLARVGTVTQGWEGDERYLLPVSRDDLLRIEASLMDVQMLLAFAEYLPLGAASATPAHPEHAGVRRRARAAWGTLARLHRLAGHGGERGD